MAMNITPVNRLFGYDRFGKRALPDAYEHLLLDAMYGDPSLFARADSIEEAWALVDPLTEAYERGESELFAYEPGTWGPKEADELMAREGLSWYADCAAENRGSGHDGKM